MGETCGIRNAMLEASIGPLDHVSMIGHRFARHIVHQLQAVGEVDRHGQEPSEGGVDHGVANDDGAGAAHDDIAVPTGAVQRGGVQAVDEYGAGNSAGYRAAAG